MASDFFPHEELKDILDELRRIRLALEVLMDEEQSKRFTKLLVYDKLADKLLNEEEQ
jgi:hypothetical protein